MTACSDVGSDGNCSMDEVVVHGKQDKQSNTACVGRNQRDLPHPIPSSSHSCNLIILILRSL